MSQLSGRDRLLLGVLVPVWLVCFGLHVATQVEGRLPGLRMLDPWVASAPAPDDYPRVVGFWPGSRPSELATGDVLLRMGERDLRGATSVQVLARALAEADAEMRVPIVVARASTRHEVLLELGPPTAPRRMLLFATLFGALGVVVLLRASQHRVARTLFAASLTYSMLWLPFPSGSELQTQAWVATRFLAAAFAYPLLLRAALLFPGQIAPRSELGLLWPFLFVLIAPSWTSLYFGTPLSHEWGVRLNPILGLSHNAVLLGVLTRNYLRADAVGRRQLRWVVFGLYVGLMPVLASLLLAAFDPRLNWLHDFTWNFLALIPVCVWIAIVRSSLFDIDRLISAAASYTLLTGAFLATLLAVVPRLSTLASASLGVAPATAQAFVAVGLAMAAVAGHRALRPQIDRFFFPESRAFDRGVEQLLQRLSELDEPRLLFELAGDRVHGLLRPESCVIYARADGQLAPVFARGRLATPGFDVESPMALALEPLVTPLCAEGTAETEAEGLDPFARAALDTLQAAVIVPVRRGETPDAFLCLGPKRSGDRYAAGELTLLAAIGDKLAGELARFEGAEVLKHERAMQQTLRRYVPDPVAAELESGETPAEREREVSVLFVDIRGYTKLSEGRDPAEVFRIVNAYTGAVSEAVRARGGTVVEFHGDGLLAVFGAPKALDEKERAAIEASRDIVDRLRGLRVGPGDESVALRVGVGIATGEDFVGHIQAGDRVIWQVIGNTTNLAARLEALSTKLEAAVVIDTPTWSRGGAATAGFRRHRDVPIAGRSEPVDVWTLDQPAG